MSNGVNIVGWAHTQFGRRSDADLESLMTEVAGPAIADAGLDVADVDAIFVGVFNNGFSKQGFEAALVGAGLPELATVPAARLENACATGSAALFAAADRIQAGRARVALVIGAEKMTGVPPGEINNVLLAGSYRRTEESIGSFAGIFAGLADRYAERYGDPHDAMAAIAAKNHRNALGNPYAHLRRDLGVDFCATPSELNPVVAGRLLRTDCSLVSDGAAALILTSDDVAKSARRAVRVRSRAQAGDHFAVASRADPLALDGAARAFGHALDEAGVQLPDLDLLETHDCFTIAELLQMEAFGIAERGKAAEVIASGATQRNGALPINVSGGLKAKGHPIGATGVSQHVMAAMQLVGEAGELQLDAPRRAAVFNMGGAGVANYASVLERIG